jgi:peptidoglycan LD-endopeptidase LytH
VTRATLFVMGAARGLSARLARVRPGWVVLVAVLVYAVLLTWLWRGALAELREARLSLAATEYVTAEVAGAPVPDSGLWLPIPGTRLPASDEHLPGAVRAYRSGVSEGFSFWPDGEGVPILFGTPVIAAGRGEVVRADHGYVEPSPQEWESLLAAVAGGASDAELDSLRGRQVWLRLDDGRIVRYGHLASVRTGLSVGQRVERGWVIGTVGNSGTPDGVAGRSSNARLHFEVRDDDGYFGEGLAPDEVRLAATLLFTGP